MSAAKLAGRAALVSALTVTLVPMLGADPAMACSCATATDKEHFKQSDVVFKGTLRKTTPPKPRPDGFSGSMDPEVFEFRATRAYKGKVTNPVRISTASSGASCGLEISGKGPFLVFANKRNAEDRKGDGPGAPKLGAGLCGGTRELGAKEKVPFGPGKAVKPAKSAKPVATAKPITPRSLESTSARSQTAVPADVALPLVAGMLALAVGSAAWATRTNVTRRPRD